MNWATQRPSVWATFLAVQYTSNRVALMPIRCSAPKTKSSMNPGESRAATGIFRFAGMIEKLNHDCRNCHKPSPQSPTKLHRGTNLP
jgi:hypothetical protein